MRKNVPGLLINGEINDDKTIRHQNQILIVTNSDGEAFTYGNLFENKDVTISLSNEWDMDRRQGTALHETMHALGYHHEHSRNDRDHFLTIKIGKDHNNDIIKSSFSITRFDPFSVMMYGEGEGRERKNETGMWKLKKDRKRSNNLSELDKVSLNILFPPVDFDNEYEPKLGRTELYYCGRKVMNGHNFPASDIVKVCGPESGPNCPACRTLRTDKMDELNKNGKFQGYSGMVYCGKEMKKRGDGHDGVGGPNNGPSGDSCLKEIFDDDEIEEYLDCY